MIRPIKIVFCRTDGNDQHSDRIAADAGRRRRSAQLYQGRPIAGRDTTGGQRADQAAAGAARHRPARQERAGRDPDVGRRTGRQLRAAAAFDQRSDSRFRRAAAGLADVAHRCDRRLHRRQYLARPRLLSRAAAAVALHGSERADRRPAARLARRRARCRGLGIDQPVRPSRPAIAGPRNWCGCAAPRRKSTMPASVPLVSYGEECPFTRSMVATLNSIGRDSELVSWAPASPGSARRWPRASAYRRCRATAPTLPGVVVWEDAPLPKLPEFFCGIYVRVGGEADDREQLADTLAAALRIRAPRRRRISAPGSRPRRRRPV